MSREKESTLIFAAGNLDRGDDGIALLIADRLNECLPAGTQIVKSAGFGLQLLDCLQARAELPDRLVIVDALATAPSGQMPKPVVSTLLNHTQLTQPERLTSSHGIGVIEGLELARTLGCLPQSVTVCGIPGQCFATGAPVSAVLMENLDALVEAIVDVCNAHA